MSTPNNHHESHNLPIGCYEQFYHFLFCDTINEWIHTHHPLKKVRVYLTLFTTPLYPHTSTRHAHTITNIIIPSRHVSRVDVFVVIPSTNSNITRIVRPRTQYYYNNSTWRYYCYDSPAAVWFVLFGRKRARPVTEVAVCVVLDTVVAAPETTVQRRRCCS